MTKEIDKRIEEGVLQEFGHVKRIKNHRFVKRVYVGDFACSHSAGTLRKR